jgi:hypothetical protein
MSDRSRCLRQVVRWDEWIPSCLSKAPISPDPRQASTSRRIRRFSAAVNRICFALATTSVLGITYFTLPFEFSDISFSSPPCTLNYWEELSHYYKHRGCYGKGRKRKIEALYPGKHPALISEETFHTLLVLRQTLGASPIVLFGRRRRIYLLTGVIFCGGCG